MAHKEEEKVEVANIQVQKRQGAQYGGDNEARKSLVETI